MSATKVIEIDPPLPNNLDAERSLLGAILVNNAVLAIARSILKPEDFFLDQHRRLFVQMVELAELSMPIDLVILAEKARSQAVLDAMGGVAYVASLMDGIPKISNAEHYAGIVKEKALLRNIIYLTDAVKQNAFAGGIVAEAILADADTRIRMLREICCPAAASTLGSCSTAELFTAQEKNIAWLCWPFAAVGLTSILDALPKIGKTVFFLHGIRASREGRPF